MYLSREIKCFDVSVAWRNNVEGHRRRQAYKSENTAKH